MPKLSTAGKSLFNHHIPAQSAIGLFGLLFFALGALLVFNHYSPQRVMDKISREVPQALGNLKREVQFGLEPSIPVTGSETTPTGLLQPGVTSKATGPLRVNPANPRYFTDGSGKAVYLTGSHTWSNLQDNGGSNPPPVFDYNAYLDFLQENNHNFFRLWSWEQSRWTVETADDNYWFSPLPYQRTGPGNALDGQPKFDLTRFNQAYFDRMRERVIAARDRGIYVSITLFDGWSVEKSKGSFNRNNPWRGHPFNKNNNVNGVNGDPNGNDSGEEAHMLGVPQVMAVQEAYVKKVIDTVNDLDNVLYEVSNESSGGSTDWQYHMIRFVKSYEAGKAKQHPVGMTAQWPGGSNDILYKSLADWIAPNGDVNNPPAADGSKVILNDTDHLCGICGDRQFVWKSFTRGLNPIFMDGYDGAGYGVGGEGFKFDDPRWVSLRKNLGYTLVYANRMNLAEMRPLPDLASSGYCLANPASNNAEYLVYLPSGGSVTVDLSGTQGELFIEWFNPGNGVTTTGGKISGGGNRSFQAPFNGDAVLYIHQNQGSAKPYRFYLPWIGQSVKDTPFTFRW